MQKPRAIISVISDLNTDQRVHKVASFLQENGFNVLVVGREKRDSAPLTERDYSTRRLRLLFSKGPLMYAAFNLRLFTFLLARRADLLVANDLDTLLPNFLISRLKRTKLVYDSHEFFTEVPELINRPRVRKVWLRIESFILPRLQTVYTVNQSIASAYQMRYKIPVAVVRNVSPSWKPDAVKSKSELGIPEGKFLVIMQGAGLNVDRGVEEAMEAIQNFDNAVLLIVGDGDAIPACKELAQQKNWLSRVVFYGKRPYSELLQFTYHSDVGLSLDKPTNPNYNFSLPNKVFDYLHTATPIICSPVQEVKKLVEQHDVGIALNEVTPVAIRGAIESLIVDENLLEKYRGNCRKAAAVENWEKETAKLRQIYFP